MRMRALFRTGRRLFVASGLFSLASALLGLQEAWVNWLFLLLFLGGAADMGIAVSCELRARRELRQDDGTRLADGVPVPVGQAERYLRSHYPGDGAQALAAALEHLREAYAPWPPEKRLAPPPSPGRDDTGLDFPEPAVYSLVDCYGKRTPPFPVHYRTPDEAQALLDGVRMTTVPVEYHTDSHHEGCPVCDAWRRDTGR